MQIIVTVRRSHRFAEEMKNWKRPFKKLKFTKIRAEQEWAVLMSLDETLPRPLNDKELEKILILLDERYRVETVMELDKEYVTWDERTSHLGQDIDVAV